MVDFNSRKFGLNHLFDGRKIIFLVTVVWILVDNRMVIPDIALNPSILVDKVLYMFEQPLVDLSLGLAPIDVFCRILAVRERDDWERVVLVHVRISDCDVISIFEAYGLWIPVQRMWKHEFFLVLFVAYFKLIIIVENSSSFSLKANITHVWIVQDVYSTAGDITAC